MQKVAGTGVALLSAGVLFLAGCSSRPDEEQMRQLNGLRDEVASLQRDIAAKEQQGASLQRELGEKDARLKKCQNDQQVVRQRLGK